MQFVLSEKTLTCSGRILRSWAIKIVLQLLPAAVRRQCLLLLAAVGPQLCRVTDPPTRTRCARILTGQRVPWSAVSLSLLRSTRKTIATASTHRLVGGYFCRGPYNLPTKTSFQSCGTVTIFLRFRFRLLKSYGSGFRLLKSHGSGFRLLAGYDSGSGSGSMGI
jgi:hypothetical protein